MSHPPYCINCISKDKPSQLHWNSDFSTEDYGFNVDGVVGVYSCPNEECGAIYEIVDFFLDRGEDIRLIKYSREHTDESIKTKEEMISTCLYCSNPLTKENIAPTSSKYGPELESDGITTSLHCPNCFTEYDVVDLYPVEDLFYEDDLDIRSSRTIFIK